MDIVPFDWERDYGRLYRACPSAFWLEPGPGDVKPQVVHNGASYGSQAIYQQYAQAYGNALLNSQYQSQLQMMQQQSSGGFGSSLLGSVLPGFW